LINSASSSFLASVLVCFFHGRRSARDKIGWLLQFPQWHFRAISSLMLNN
jgi:hypothetical protein